MHSLGKTLLAFAFFVSYPKAKLACCSRYLLTSYFCILVPCDVKEPFLGVNLEGLVGLHRNVRLQLL